MPCVFLFVILNQPRTGNQKNRSQAVEVGVDCYRLLAGGDGETLDSFGVGYCELASPINGNDVGP